MQKSYDLASLVGNDIGRMTNNNNDRRPCTKKATKSNFRRTEAKRRRRMQKLSRARNRS